METFNPLQQPGGLGPLPALKALGVAPAGAGNYANSESFIRERQRAQTDSVNRVFAQYNVDHGSYTREPVSPLEYGIGNVVKSHQVTGPAGYNHQSPPLPMAPDDMPKSQYVIEEANKLDPTMRLNVGMLSLMPQQNFYNRTTEDSKIPPMDYRMSDNLSLQQQVVGGGDAI